MSSFGLRDHCSTSILEQTLIGHNHYYPSSTTKTPPKRSIIATLFNQLYPPTSKSQWHSKHWNQTQNLYQYPPPHKKEEASIDRKPFYHQITSRANKVQLFNPHHQHSKTSTKSGSPKTLHPSCDVCFLNIAPASPKRLLCVQRSRHHPLHIIIPNLERCQTT